MSPGPFHSLDLLIFFYQTPRSFIHGLIFELVFWIHFLTSL